MKKPTIELKDNYVVIQSWMVRDLGLKGNQLILYALIYGFSQTEKQICTCGIEYMGRWTNSTKQGVLKMLDALVNDGLIERVENFGDDKRKIAYRAIGKESLPISDTFLGQQSLPKSTKIGKESLPKIGKQSLQNRSTLFRATYDNNNINNIMTDLSVSQRAGAREDETDRQTDKEFYLDRIRERFDEYEDPYKGDYESRFKDILAELSHWDKVKVNGMDMPTEKVFQAILDIFRDPSPDRLHNAMMCGVDAKIKRKFNYTVTALYNAGKQF